MSKSKGSDHIEEMLEWEKKQYTPWEYAQEGKLPPYLKAKGNQKRAAILFFIQGGIIVLIIGLTLLQDSNVIEDWPGLLFLAAIAVLCFMAAANYLRKWKATKLLKDKQKTKKIKRSKTTK